MPPRLILFTGAPDASTLNWDERDLLDKFSDPIIRFAQLEADQEVIPVTPTPTSSVRPAWRSLPLERKHLATGHSQDHGWQKENQGTQFFAASYVDSFMEELSSQVPVGDSYKLSLESVEQVLSQFYEESYAVHQDIPSSQIAAVTQSESSYITEGTSFNTTESFESITRSFGRAKDVPVAGNLCNLKDVPNAVYLNSIQPQTITVNLIVGIISMPSPRAIKTRRGADVELIEMLVGDDTKSGFGINFWLSSLSQPTDSNMKAVLNGLRPQDVVLVRNVALSSFRGKVYGQSLRKDMTKVHLLYRNKFDKTDDGGCYSAADLMAGEVAHPQVEKTRRAREWVTKFVGAGTGQRIGKGRAFEPVEEVLPPDTQ